jgi:hypothetical protein
MPGAQQLDEFHLRASRQGIKVLFDVAELPDLASDFAMEGGQTVTSNLCNMRSPSNLQQPPATRSPRRSHWYSSPSWIKRKLQLEYPVHRGWHFI